jgi:hypothetical protein
VDARNWQIQGLAFGGHGRLGSISFSLSIVIIFNTLFFLNLKLIKSEGKNYILFKLTAEKFIFDGTSIIFWLNFILSIGMGCLTR